MNHIQLVLLNRHAWEKKNDYSNLLKSGCQVDHVNTVDECIEFCQNYGKACLEYQRKDIDDMEDFIGISVMGIIVLVIAFIARWQSDHIERFA